MLIATTAEPADPQLPPIPSQFSAWLGMAAVIWAFRLMITNLLRSSDHSRVLSQQTELLQRHGQVLERMMSILDKIQEKLDK